MHSEHPAVTVLDVQFLGRVKNKKKKFYATCLNFLSLKMRCGQTLLISQYRQSLRNLMTVTEERLVPGQLYTQTVAGHCQKKVHSLLTVTRA